MDELLRAYGKWTKTRHYKSEKWHNLYAVLINTKSIDTATTFEVFNYVMENKHLPASADKIQLLISTVRAMDFQKMTGFTIPQMNKCFKSKNGKPFHEKYRDARKRHPTPDIIKKITDTL